MVLSCAQKSLPRLEPVMARSSHSNSGLHDDSDTPLFVCSPQQTSHAGPKPHARTESLWISWEDPTPPSRVALVGFMLRRSPMNSSPPKGPWEPNLPPPDPEPQPPTPPGPEPDSPGPDWIDPDGALQPTPAGKALREIARTVLLVRRRALLFGNTIRLARIYPMMGAQSALSRERENVHRKRVSD